MVSRKMARRLTGCVAGSALAMALPVVAAPTEGLGPYNAAFMQGGIGIDRALAPSPLLAAGASLTLSAWVNARDMAQGTVGLIALGDPSSRVHRGRQQRDSDLVVSVLGKNMAKDDVSII